jgi:threonine dehydrogenase-like Zn-dependent dehydrogenase
MKALVWHGKYNVSVDTVPDPVIQEPKDAIIKITSTAICGSDLHLYDGYQPAMEDGDVLGHEPMGIVVEVGSAVTKLKKGDRVVVPSSSRAARVSFAQRRCFSACDTTNPDAEKARKLMGHAPSGAFGFSHLLGGYAGGQAEYLRVPHADVGPIKIESICRMRKCFSFRTFFRPAYMAAENADIEPGDTVAVWGCGPVAQMCIQSCWMLGAGRVIAIDRVPERLAMARTQGRAETINFDEQDVYETLNAMTQGRGPDRCIDAVGCEAHNTGAIDAVIDKVKASVMLATDRAHVIRQAIYCCRKAGTVSVPGVYVGMIDKFPFGQAMNKGLTIKTGQTHVQRYGQLLLKKIEAGAIDPSFVITHKLPLEDAPGAYKTFRDKEDGCIKVVLKP